MTTTGTIGSLIGESAPRNEDRRLLTGDALFVDDVHLDGMLHVAFVRSDYAHGYLRRVDLSEARAHPGVIAVYAADDLGDYWLHRPRAFSSGEIVMNQTALAVLGEGCPDASEQQEQKALPNVPDGYRDEEAQARIMDVTVQTLRSMASRRKGPPRVKQGRRPLYRIAAYEAYLLARETDFEADF